MHPDPPKREQEIREHVKMWQDRLKRLEAHEHQYKLAPVFKINALRMLMMEGQGVFRLVEADRDHADPAKSFEELLNKAQDYARKRNLDNTAQKNTQHGGDSMDVGAAQGDWSE